MDEGDKKPVPDPTALTTIQLQNEIRHVKDEINHLKELVEQHQALSGKRTQDILVEMDKRYQARFEEQGTAVRAAQTAADRAVQEFKTLFLERVDALREATSARFTTLRTVVDALADKAALALAAADKAVDKAENYSNKQHDQHSKEIDDLKDIARTLIGRGSGMNAAWVYAVGAIAAFSTIVSLFVRFG